MMSNETPEERQAGEEEYTNGEAQVIQAIHRLLEYMEEKHPVLMDAIASWILTKTETMRMEALRREASLSIFRARAAAQRANEEAANQEPRPGV